MITVIGGTYREIDYDSSTYEIFGSGFRCCKFLLENDCSVSYLTSGNHEVNSYLLENKKVYSNLSFQCNSSPELISFKYIFSLDSPDVFPSLLEIQKTEGIIASGGDIICFGMVETDVKIINGNKVVYDPQTPIEPRRFSQFGDAEELIYIVNRNEAQSISSSKDLKEIKRFFFEKETAIAFIIKDGPYGATLFVDDKEIHIPSYRTPNVHKIGSGDVFTASFGYYWIEKGLPLETCAMLASQSTAYFCDKQAYIDVSTLEEISYERHNANDLSKKQIYLAAPFFSLAELVLIDKIRTSFLGFGVSVFSPYHDIGFGNHISIAKKDLEAISASDVIFCMFDGLDSGTLIESGFAMANDKTIIGYVNADDKEALLMLKPGQVKLYNHLTTAIYQTIWSL